MVSHYSVVQYLPDPATGERINLGIVAYDDSGRVVHHFIDNWSRVKNFASIASVTNLRESVNKMFRDLGPEEVLWASENWSRSIQLTPVLGSTAKLDELVGWLISTVLVDRPTTHLAQSKRGLQRRALTAIEKSLLRFHTAEELEVQPGDVRGKVYKYHPIEVTARNGKMIVAAPVISLSQKNVGEMRSQIGKAAWAIQDIQQLGEVPNVAVLVAGGSNVNRDLLNEAKDIFPNYEAAVVVESGLSSWAKGLATV